MAQQAEIRQMPSVVVPMVTVMCWPLLAGQFWLELGCVMLRRHGTETDAGDIKGQLPVPDAIQETMDSKLLA